jgi:hypothetical protein
MHLIQITQKIERLSEFVNFSTDNNNNRQQQQQPQGNQNQQQCFVQYQYHHLFNPFLRLLLERMPAKTRRSVPTRRSVRQQKLGLVAFQEP